MATAKTALLMAPKDDITNQLLARFKELISRGLIPPGAKLPPERELAQKFGVSRSSLRHALKILESMGVLMQRVGDGTYLTTDAARILSQPLEFLVMLDGISLLDLMETRMIVEPELAARAAERATTEDLAALRQSIQDMQREPDEAKLIAADMAFHRAIFAASGNRLCERLFTVVHQAMAKSMETTQKMVDWEHTVSFHAPVYDAIDRRQPAEARQAMIAHLNDARELVRRAVTATKAVDLLEDLHPIRRMRPEGK